MKSASLGAAATILTCCLMLTNSATAKNNVDFSNAGGTLSGTNSGLSLSGSMLIAVIGLNGGSLITGDLGSVSFNTGSLASGSLAMGGTLHAGGNFAIQGNGNNGIPSGVLFSGPFSGPVTWTMITLANGTHNYTLTGMLVGTIGGKTVNGVTAQLTINTGMGFFQNSTFIAGGDTATISSVPEPSTLALVLTGSIGTVGMMRRKLLVR